MDFSTAGYMGGGVALPDVPVKKTVQPTSGPDDTAAIQAAIDAVSILPVIDGFRGAVLLAPGQFKCSNTISIAASGVVLRGSGSGPGEKRSTIRMAGGKHVAIAIKAPGNTGSSSNNPGPKTFLADSYVPSGTNSFTVADAAGFSTGDTIEIRRPVTEAWIKFMHMDDLQRDGKPQTWIRAGSSIAIQRRIASLAGNKITLDVPLSDSFDAKFLNPPGTPVLKIKSPALVSHVALEHLHIESPAQNVNHTEELYTAVRLTGEDCWMRDVAIEETMNSVTLNGRRLTLEGVSVTRKILHVGSSKPAEFAPNGDQILLDRCAVTGDNIWFVATGGGHAGPIVLLNCNFTGNGHIEGHQRWTTGLLLDNCRAPAGGIDFKNRGSMGSGHGWGLAWAVAWNCAAKSFLIQQPPGACNWAIGCMGERATAARPFDAEPKLPEGIFDSPGQPVAPRSLYLAQLAERLGPQALKNIGYAGQESR